MGPFILEIAEPRVPWESVTLHWHGLAVSGPKGAAIQQNYRYYMNYLMRLNLIIQYDMMQVRIGPKKCSMLLRHLSTPPCNIFIRLQKGNGLEANIRIKLSQVLLQCIRRAERQRVDQVGTFVEIRQYL